MLVAVSQRVDFYPDRNERRDALDQRLIAFLSMVGFIALAVPNCLPTEKPEGSVNRLDFDNWISQVNPQGIILSGGNDLGACRDRDITEGFLLDYAERHKLPVLGICRGMQMMSVRAGAQLKLLSGHVRIRHQIIGEISDEVNSFHNYSLVECPSNFSILAHSEDGQIEAIRHKSLPWEGWMWHPERESIFSSRDIKRLRALFS